MWEYTDTVREHFLHPRNAGELADANAIGEVGSLACGDALKLFLKISKDGVIEDASFQTFGCASAIASSSALTELIKGKTVDEVIKITNKDIAAYLGGLPREKMHCSVMGQEALEAALRNWRGEKALPHAPEGRLICKCFGVTDTQIRRAIQENSLKSVEEITNYTKAGGGCGDCLEKIQQILDEELGKPGLHELNLMPKAKLTNVQRMQKVMQALEAEVKPRLAADGGDIELVDVDGHRVVVALRGQCSSCRSRTVTLTDLVQKILREQVEPEIVVEEVKA
ncbi:MAG: Fe-S cluster assembly protein NifU [Bilophila sp.]